MSGMLLCQPVVKKSYNPYLYNDYAGNPGFTYTDPITKNSTNRPNHGVVQSLRTPCYIEELTDMLKQILPEQYWHNKFFSAEKLIEGYSYLELTRIATLFSVAGRENELGV